MFAACGELVALVVRCGGKFLRGIAIFVRKNGELEGVLVGECRVSSGME